MQLKDKVAVITGAGGGLGIGIARRFAREGAKLALCDINEAAVQALARIGGDDAKKTLEQAVARGPGSLAATCRRLLSRWGAA